MHVAKPLVDPPQLDDRRRLDVPLRVAGYFAV
jgi:hypothetical protein